MRKRTMKTAGDIETNNNKKIKRVTSILTLNVTVLMYQLKGRHCQIRLKAKFNSCHVQETYFGLKDTKGKSKMINFWSRWQCT